MLSQEVEKSLAREILERKTVGVQRLEELLKVKHEPLDGVSIVDEIVVAGGEGGVARLEMTPRRNRVAAKQYGVNHVPIVVGQKHLVELEETRLEEELTLLLTAEQLLQIVIAHECEALEEIGKEAVVVKVVIGDFAFG